LAGGITQLININKGKGIQRRKEKKRKEKKSLSGDLALSPPQTPRPMGSDMYHHHHSQEK
jgi:hypothetical protein